MLKKLIKNVSGVASFVAIIIILGLTFAGGIVFKNYFTKVFNNTIDNAENAFGNSNEDNDDVVITPDEEVPLEPQKTYVGNLATKQYFSSTLSNRDFTNSWEKVDMYQDIGISGNCVFEYLGELYYVSNSDSYKLNTQSGIWEKHSWKNSFAYNYGSYMWSDGETLYYSFDKTQYKSTDAYSWEKMEWGGCSDFRGSDIWTDGTDFYLDDDYVLDKETKTWETISWNISFTVWTDMWSDNENIYVYKTRSNYRYDKVNKIWVLENNWPRNNYVPAFGSYIWSDSENIYCSDNSNNIYSMLDKQNNEWIKRDEEQNKNISANNIWKSGDNIYCSDSNSSVSARKMYVFERKTKTWVEHKQLSYFTRNNQLWTNGALALYSNYGDYFELNNETMTWIIGGAYAYSGGNNIWTDGEKYYYYYSSSGHNSVYTYNDGKFTSQTQYFHTEDGKVFYPNGRYVWTDGENIYYSGFLDTDQYKWNKETNAWETVTWNLSITYGSYIWSDGDDIFYSRGSGEQYIFNKEEKKWKYKSWKGISSSNLSGSYIWSDGTNIYLSSGTLQYKLNKETDTWEKIVWEGV